MITKEYLANYLCLDKYIEETKKKIDYYKEHPPVVEYGRVYGSSAYFPYTAKGFNVSGYNGVNSDKWENKVKKLHEKLVNQLREFEEMKIEIENFISDMPKEMALEKLIFTYVYIRGMSQTEVAMKLNIDQSNISRKITECLKRYNLKQLA